MSSRRTARFESLAVLETAMKTQALLGILLEIEQAVGRWDPMVVRELVIEAESYVLEVERELIEVLQDNERLRRTA